MHPRLWYRQGEVLSGCAIYLMFSSPVNTRPSSVPAHQGLWSLPTRLPGEASSQCWDAPGGTCGSETRCKRERAAWPSVRMSAPPQNEETSLRSCFSSRPGWFSEQHRCLRERGCSSLLEETQTKPRCWWEPAARPGPPCPPVPGKKLLPAPCAASHVPSQPPAEPYWQCSDPPETAGRLAARPILPCLRR